MSPVGYVPDAPVLLAHHPIALALPFVLPVLLVVGMVAVVAWRDRHRPPDGDEIDREDDRQDEPAHDGQPGSRRQATPPRDALVAPAPTSKRKDDATA